MNKRLPDDPRFTPVHLRRELLGAGWTDRSIGHQVRIGAWVRIRHGAYVDARAWSALDEAGRHEVRSRAVLKQACTPSVPSHVSAVPLFDGPTWGLDLSTVHTTRLDGKTGRQEAGVCQHAGVVLPGDVVTRHGQRVMSATRTALEVTTATDIEPALVVMNDFMHRNLTDPATIRARYDLGMDHWPETRQTEIVIRLADPRIESVLESRFCFICYLHGLPKPVPQYEVFDNHGRPAARLDFAWPDLGRYVECDGKGKYTKLLKPGEDPGDVVFREKRREDLVREITGWVGLRVTWADAEQPDRTAHRVRQLLYPARNHAG